MELLTNPIFSAVTSLIILIYSAILHEIAHGYVADRLGDPTARLLGRLTLNPKPHIDPWMSIALPLILFLTSPVIFGGAKPVPVDEFNLRDGERDLALVAISGPLTNVLIAVMASIIFHGLLMLPFTGFTMLLLQYLFIKVITINVLLAIFNLLPIPPLDGSKIFSLLLPPQAARTYLAIGNFGPILLFLLLLSPLTQGIIRNLNSFALSLLGF